MTNASGVGTLVALAPGLAAVARACDTWLVATGAEERPYTGQADHRGPPRCSVACGPRGAPATSAGPLSLDEVGRGRELWLRSPARRRFEARVLAAASARPQAGDEPPREGDRLRVRWVADSGTGNSDHREFGLAAKLGVPDEPLRHTAADTARRLHATTFPRVRRLVERLLGA